MFGCTQEANVRATQISNVAYAQWLGFDAKSETYEGETEITFQYSGEAAAEGVFVDFTGTRERGCLHAAILQTNQHRV